MKIRGVVTGAHRDLDVLGSQKHKVFVSLDSEDGASGQITLPISAALYEEFSKNSIFGPFEVEVDLKFDKRAGS